MKDNALLPPRLRDVYIYFSDKRQEKPQFYFTSLLISADVWSELVVSQCVAR